MTGREEGCVLRFREVVGGELDAGERDGMYGYVECRVGVVV